MQDDGLLFLFTMMSTIFVPFAGMLCGYLALRFRVVPFAMLGVAVVGGFFGYFVLKPAAADPQLGIFMVMWPVLAPLGIAAGAAMGLGEHGDIKTHTKKAEHWAALTSDAEFNGHFHLFVECAELAGDHYMKAQNPAKAVQIFQKAWDRQVALHDVHACMFTLGEKLVAALKAHGKPQEAAAIQHALEQADKRAEAIVSEELAAASA